MKLNTHHRCICLWALGAFSIAAAACGTQDPIKLGSVHVKEQHIIAAEGGTIEVTASDYAKLAGTKIVIPAGALAEDTRITIGYDPNDLAGEESDLIGAPVVELGPAGTQFSTPAEITIPYGSSFDEDLARVMVREADGTARVILPHALAYDAATGTVRFSTEHFTRFQGHRGRHRCAHVQCPSNQCRRGRCVNDCSDPSACGPAPGVPSWTCEDGTAGGSTGRCLPTSDGQCGWEIIWCPRGCDAAECGPRPLLPNYECADGTIAGPTDRCVRHADGQCGWEIVQCTDDCRASNTRCPADTVCDASTGQCVPAGGETCGNVTCSTGLVCCNASCGTCARPDMACTQQACEPCNGRTCAAGEQCDPATNRCTPVTCDPSSCGPAPGLANWVCEDGTTGGPTGRCLPGADGQCGWEIIWCPRACSSTECGPEPTSNNGPCNSTCTRGSDGQCRWGECTAACDPSQCGPRPGIPNYTCQDGTIGGPTGRCLRDAATNQCGWEIVDCPR
ncbi:MAG: hypothetical protein IT384_01705 [Deltaproteobacteria bacterium]|nr:hypothetical protein [Deltaproteobacteria bacterium]